MRKSKLFLLTFVALLGGVNSAVASKTVYLQPGEFANDGAVISLWIWGGSNSGSWYAGERTEVESGIFRLVLDDEITSMKITRGKVGNTWDNGDDLKWNESGDLTVEAGKLYKANGYDNDTMLFSVEAYTEPVVEEPAGYTVDFNTEIATSDHAFQVASNWRHIVDTYESSWSYDSQYANYSYSTTAGVDGSGALSCSTNQNSNSIYDLLVTPVVKGTVTIDAKATATYYTPQLSFFKITDNGDGTFTRGEQITVDVSAVNATDYVTITIPVDEAGERIGIRSSYVWLDNFTATEATIIPESKISFVSATSADGNNGTTGQIKWEQQANGKVLVSYTVVVTNTGDVDLVQGDENYSISIIHRETGNVIATVPVPQDLAKGETSNEFVVSGEAESSVWPNSYTEVHIDLKENLFGSTIQRANSTYIAYEPKFVFRAAESTSTSSITTAESWGTITESTTKSFEIANTGTAPLTIKSVTLPEGFTSDNAPTAEFTLAKGTTQALNITQDAAAQGTFAGNLAIVYLDKNGDEQTYTLAFSATVIGANTWTADFNGSSSSNVTYPAGSIAEGGIDKDYQYISSGNYNLWLLGRNATSYKTENNKFITPKLHANAGDKLAFDVKAGYSSSDDYFVKVYVSADRQNWGEPVETYVYSNVGSSFTTKTISFDTAGDYYVAFALFGNGSGIDNLVGLEKVDVAHDLYIKSVSWPNASEKSGTALSKPSVDIIPLTNEAAENYTVKYIYGENEVAIESKDLTASASSTTSFTASFTPEVEETTTFPGTKVVFEFTDGTKFETETFDLTVTNEPIFHFLSSKYTSRWYEPSSDYNTPYSFGKTNETGASKTFWILNWGSAPLTVKSIAVPEGFTTSVSEMTLPAFDGTSAGLETCQQSFDVTFSATEAGTYSGNLVITYVNGAGEDATFELALSGTMLDSSKFYANFGAESNQWPAGSVYQSNVSTTYVASGDYAITSSSTTNNLFVTPKLTAAEGEKLLFDAKLYSTSWSEGKVVVYAAATRDEVLNAEEGTTRQQLFSVSGQDEEGAMTTDYQTFEVPALAGDYYYGFEISNRPYVDEIYGLTQTAVAHDWALVSSNIPTEGMQNVASTATVNIANFGIADEAADDIQVIAYVDGEAVATAEGVAIPMSHQLSATGTQLSVNFRSPKAGTFPVYVEVKADDYSVQTEAVDVTFAEEEAQSEATADADGVSSYVPLNTNYYNSESVSLYTASVLEGSYGLSAGSKIKSITYKGYKTADEHSSTLNVWYQWVDETSQSKPADGLYDTDGMTQIVTDETKTWEKKGSSTALEDFITLNFAEPLVYQEGKALRIVIRSVATVWKQVYFEKSTTATDGLAYYHYNDNYSTFASNSWSSSVLPVLHMDLEATTTTLSGTVKDAEDAAVEGATVTLVSADGDGVQYTGTTAADGSYSINVIQSSRTYDVTVAKAGLPDATATVAFNGESQTKDFYMVEPLVVTFVNGANWEKVYAYTYETEQSGSWPGTEISKTGTTTISGEEYDVYTYSLQTLTAPAHIIFNNGGTGDGNQTADLDFADGEQYVYGITTYTVAGAFKAEGSDSEEVASIFGSIWNTDNTDNDMTKNDEGIYELSFEGVDLVAGVISFKVVENHSWDVNYGGNGAGGNYEITISEAGNYNITLTFDPAEKTVSHSIEKNIGTGISNLDTTNTLDGDIYNVGGVRSDKLQRGQLNIVRTKDGKVRKVVIK